MKIFFLCLMFMPLLGFSQHITKFPEIPRIDVHSHVHNDYGNIANYLLLRDYLKSNHNVDLAMWISLDGNADTISKLSGGRIMTTLGEYAPHRGLTYKPEDMAAALLKGYVGYKIWHGPAERRLREGETGILYFDDPAHTPVLSAAEKARLPLASLHIADPNGPFGNRGSWAVDPVKYWRQIIGLERVLQRHPDLVIIAAHCAWLICQDAQIDFLRYLLATYPNLHVDLAATFQYFHLVSHANLRDFIIEYADRILYGTDIGRLTESGISGTAERYMRTFRILETDQMVEGGFFGMNPVRGLNLPREVLEKIYYKNALRLYPGLANQMSILGYKHLLK